MTPTTQKCSVVEGWASFVGAATLWQSNSPNPLWASNFRVLEGDTMDGNSILKPCVLVGPNEHLVAGNVVRWFWDLYDTTTTGDDGQDNATWTPAYMAQQWEEFGYGTTNRKVRESGNNGRNAWDYEWHESGAESELVQNCLGGQAP